MFQLEISKHAELFRDPDRLRGMCRKKYPPRGIIF